MVKGRKVALGLDLIHSYQQHKPSAGASLNVAQRATSRLVYTNFIRMRRYISWDYVSNNEYS